MQCGATYMMMFGCDGAALVPVLVASSVFSRTSMLKIAGVVRLPYCSRAARPPSIGSKLVYADVYSVLQQLDNHVLNSTCHQTHVDQHKAAHLLMVADIARGIPLVLLRCPTRRLCSYEIECSRQLSPKPSSLTHMEMSHLPRLTERPGGTH